MNSGGAQSSPGALVFALSQRVPALLAGRSLIGLGVSASLMSSIKAFTLWYPLQRLPAMTGWALFCGGLGAMAATAPVEAALQLTDWRGVFLTMSVLTFAASAAIFWLVLPRPAAIIPTATAPHSQRCWYCSCWRLPGCWSARASPLSRKGPGTVS